MISALAGKRAFFGEACCVKSAAATSDNAHARSRPLPLADGVLGALAFSELKIGISFTMMLFVSLRTSQYDPLG